MNNPVAIKSAGREYYGKNKERVREYAQICYHLKNNKGKTKIYYTGKNIKKEFNDMYEREEEKKKKELQTSSLHKSYQKKYILYFY